VNDFIQCHRFILQGLIDEMEHRSNLDGWVERERLAVIIAANKWALAHGLNTVTVEQVEAIEHLAIGHVDYASKLALYVAELVNA